MNDVLILFYGALKALFLLMITLLLLKLLGGIDHLSSCGSHRSYKEHAWDASG
jgi:hypothetical protein